MKSSLVKFCFLIISCTSVYGQEEANPTYFTDFLYLNKIQITVTNFGSGLNFNFWDNEYSRDVLYDYGPFFVSKSDTGIVWAQNAWTTYFTPGSLAGDKPLRRFLPENTDTFRVYNIQAKDSLFTTRDKTDWPTELGAPTSTANEPLCFADGSTFAVYNTADSNFINRNPQFALEVQQNIYAYAGNKAGIPLDFLDEVIFIEYKFINKGNISFDSAYCGFWTDLDISASRLAVDTASQTGYMWMDYKNKTPSFDSVNAAAVGFTQLYGPMVESAGNNAIISGIVKRDYKNLPLTAYHPVGDDSYADTFYYGIARKREHAYYMAQGLDKFGRNVKDPLTGNVTKFPLSYNPVLTENPPNYPQSGGDGFYLFSGPFNLAPGDTNWVMYAYLPVAAGGPLKSVIELKRRALALLSLNYDDYVVKTPMKKIQMPDEPVIPEKFGVYQNYPNPFNSLTNIRFDLPNDSNVQIRVFNSLGEKVKEINLGILAAGEKNHTLHLSGASSGVYFVRIEVQGASELIKMVYLK